MREAAPSLVDGTLWSEVSCWWPTEPAKVAARTLEYLDDALAFVSVLKGQTSRTVYQAVVDHAANSRSPRDAEKMEVLACSLQAVIEALRYLLRSANGASEVFGVAEAYVLLITATRVTGICKGNLQGNHTYVRVL